MFIRFPTAPQSTDWYQCQPHRSIKRISLLPQWFMKVIIPTLTRFPKKSACSSTLAKCFVCALGETGADMVLWNRTGNTEQCGGHRAHAISKDNFHAAGLSRGSCTVGSNGSSLCHTSCHEEYKEMGWSQVPLRSSWLCLQPCCRISLRKNISTQLEPRPCPPHQKSLSVSHTLTHTFFFPAGRRHLI